VVPLLPGPVILFPGWSAQRVQHLADDRGALGGQVSVDHPGPAERGGQLETAVREVPVRVLIGPLGPGPFVHFRGHRGQFVQPQPARRSVQQELVRGIPPVLRQLVRPQADQPPSRPRPITV
jgi:hypothetical protein